MITLTDSQIDFSAAMDYVLEQYDKVVLLTISDTVLRKLYQKKVITVDDKTTIQKLDTEKKMEHLLDYVITPSLESKHSLKFINFINVLKTSDDVSLQTMASELIACSCK